MSRLLASHPDFVLSLGRFHIAWAAADGVIDYAIGQFLRLSHEETHLLTAGRDFGRKARLLESLVQRSDHARKADLIANLRKIQNKSKRNILAHSMIGSTENTVTFLDRNTSQSYKATAHTFDKSTFAAHVIELHDAAGDFQLALGVSDDDLDAFFQAAIKANAKAPTSPRPPNSKA